MMAMSPRAAHAQPAPVQVAAPVQAQAPLPGVPAQGAPAPVQTEQKLDTSSPVMVANNLQVAKVRTQSDERLPKWVPKKARLSVVDSSDLAENLGLVAKGTTKKNPEERVSVADKLEEESARRAKDPNNYATSFSYAKAGRVRSRL